MRLCVLLMALLPLRAAAATPTDTPTATPTATPGEGSYLLSPAAFTLGSSGNELEMVYTAGSSAWGPSGGLLTVYFPLGLSLPNASNFYPKASDASKVLASSFGGNQAQFQVTGLAPGATLTLRYGYNSSGFTVSAAQASLALEVFSNPLSLAGQGGRLQVQPTIAVQSPTQTPTSSPTLTVTETATISPTFSITVTHSESPTFTVSPTFTQTLTQTPLGEIRAGELYSYPNPFDLAKYDKVTLRFPPDASAQVTIFNLVGEPVADLIPADINGAAGWAIWRGRDEYNRPASGGIYFARVKGASTYIKRFTVLN